jgi:hypothetical protein
MKFFFTIFFFIAIATAIKTATSTQNFFVFLLVVFFVRGPRADQKMS